MCMTIADIAYPFFFIRWINCLITAIQKHKKFNKGPDREEGVETFLLCFKMFTLNHLIVCAQYKSCFPIYFLRY